jgi:hypothetical protein
MSHDVLITLLAVVTPIVLVGAAKWVAWSVTNAIDEKLDAKIDPIARRLEEHMSEEARSNAVNNDQHDDFRRRMRHQEERLNRLEGHK